MDFMSKLIDTFPHHAWVALCPHGEDPSTRPSGFFIAVVDITKAIPMETAALIHLTNRVMDGYSIMIGANTEEDCAAMKDYLMRSIDLLMVPHAGRG